MRLWLNHTGGVSLREQLVTQVVLGILSRDLTAGERLPSTRELARRYSIHANTASRAYRQLERDGWLEFRHGSGVFVRSSPPAIAVAASPVPERESALTDDPPTVDQNDNQIDNRIARNVDRLIADLIAKATHLGASATLVRERLRRYLAQEPPDRWLVIEPDAELRAILVFEMQAVLSLPVAGCAPEDFSTADPLSRFLPVARPTQAESVRKLLPAETELATLEIRAIGPSMQKYLPHIGNELIAVASRWKEFVRTANTILIAAGIDPDRLIVRDATRPGWKRGLDQTFGILSDAALQQHLPTTPHRIAFRLLDEESLARLQRIELALSHSDLETKPF